jgi:hypothetical protein
MAHITDKMSLRAFYGSSFVVPAGMAGQQLRLLQILKGGTTYHAVFGFFLVHCDLKYTLSVILFQDHRELATKSMHTLFLGFLTSKYLHAFAIVFARG